MRHQQARAAVGELVPNSKLASPALLQWRSYTILNKRRLFVHEALSTRDAVGQIMVLAISGSAIGRSRLQAAA